ncbi:ABC transporter permease [Psittacicella melopsittaci]|nr:ABC transporter permease [Psittacicella melopsittaci]
MMQKRSKHGIVAHSLISILIQEVTRNLAEWIENIFNPIVNSFLYIIVFGVLLGSIIGQTAGVNYGIYILSGFIIMNIINTSYDEGSYFIMLHKYSKTLTDFQVAPIRVHTIILGVYFASLIRVGFISLAIYLLGSCLVGFAPISHIWIVLGIALITIAMFTFLGLINGVLSHSWEQLNFALTFIITPLIYVSGIFYDISQIPSALKYISHINPLTYIVDSFRYGMINVQTLNVPLYLYFALLCVVMVALYALTCYVFKRKLNIK